MKSEIILPNRVGLARRPEFHHFDDLSIVHHPAKPRTAFAMGDSACLSPAARNGRYLPSGLASSTFDILHRVGRIGCHFRFTTRLAKCRLPRAKVVDPPRLLAAVPFDGHESGHRDGGDSHRCIQLCSRISDILSRCSMGCRWLLPSHCRTTGAFGP